VSFIVVGKLAVWTGGTKTVLAELISQIQQFDIRLRSDIFQ
jgi:hypothetical protein